MEKPDPGRLVPPHGSGPVTVRTPPGFRRSDPDETAGRLLYRQRAEAEARRSLAGARGVILRD